MRLWQLLRWSKENRHNCITEKGAVGGSISEYGSFLREGNKNHRLAAAGSAVVQKLLHLPQRFFDTALGFSAKPSAIKIRQIVRKHNDFLFFSIICRKDILGFTEKTFLFQFSHTLQKSHRNREHFTAAGRSACRWDFLWRKIFLRIRS